MDFLITGGTGFIGTRLCGVLLDKGHGVTVLTRDKKKAEGKVDKRVELIESLDGLPEDFSLDVIVNLAGEPISDARWSKERKKELIGSRVSVTGSVVGLISRLDKKPALLVSGSAIGYYGSHKDEDLIESSEPNKEFTNELCARWEESALKAEEFGVRVVLLRTGIVLGKGGGALSKLLPPFRLGLGGRIGNGMQWMSWVHIDDHIGIILHAVDDSSIDGPLNATAPNPVRNREFASTLGMVLRRPALLPMPGLFLKFIYGEMADRLLLSGQRVLPKKAKESGYRFLFPELEDALRDIL
jgi:uncharacterized protein (TIGR01777 family)